MCRHLQIETEISGKLISPERRCQGYAGFGMPDLAGDCETMQAWLTDDEAASTRCLR